MYGHIQILPQYAITSPRSIRRSVARVGRCRYETRNTVWLCGHREVRRHAGLDTNPPHPCLVRDDSTTLIQPKPGHRQWQVSKPGGTAQHPQWVRPRPWATQEEHACLSTCPMVPSSNSFSPSRPHVIPCTFSPTLLADNQIEAVLQPSAPAWTGWITTFHCWTKVASSKDSPASPAQHGLVAPPQRGIWCPLASLATSSSMPQHTSQQWLSVSEQLPRPGP